MTNGVVMFLFCLGGVMGSILLALWLSGRGSQQAIDGGEPDHSVDYIVLDGGE